MNDREAALLEYLDMAKRSMDYGDIEALRTLSCMSDVTLARLQKGFEERRDGIAASVEQGEHRGACLGLYIAIEAAKGFLAMKAPRGSCTSLKLLIPPKAASAMAAER